MFRFTENALEHFCNAISWFCTEHNASVSTQPEMQIVAELVYPAMNDGTPVEVGVYVPESFPDAVQQIIDFVMTSYKKDYDRNYARPYPNDRSFRYELMFLGQSYAEHPNTPKPVSPPIHSYVPPYSPPIYETNEDRLRKSQGLGGFGKRWPLVNAPRDPFPGHD